MSRPALLTCALPEMVAPIAFGRNAADDEDCMSEMARCNMNTTKVKRGKDVDRSGSRGRWRRSEISRR